MRLEANSSEQMQAVGTPPVAARAGAVEGRGAPHPGRVRPSLWLPELLRPGKAQNAGATEPTLLEYLKTGTALNAGPTPYRAAGSLSSYYQTGKAQTPLYGANPVWPEHGESSPHTVISVCSAPPSPQQD